MASISRVGNSKRSAGGVFILFNFLFFLRAFALEGSRKLRMFLNESSVTLVGFFEKPAADPKSLCCLRGIAVIKFCLIRGRAV